jgi:hypothetical protein
MMSHQIKFSFFSLFLPHYLHCMLYCSIFVASHQPSMSSSGGGGSSSKAKRKKKVAKGKHSSATVTAGGDDTSSNIDVNNAGMGDDGGSGDDPHAVSPSPKGNDDDAISDDGRYTLCSHTPYQTTPHL